MTLGEKRRLRRIVASNATQYRITRHDLALAVMRGGATTDPDKLKSAQHYLTFHALQIAEATASLEEHVDAE